MPHQITQDRMLPLNWEDTRTLKRGFRIHQKCWGRILAFFSIDMKWDKKTYINIPSAKHWWKSNDAWRERCGFSGAFSVTRFKALLKLQIQAKTTTQAIQQISPKPAEIKPQPPHLIPQAPKLIHTTQPLTATVATLIPPITDAEKLKQFCKQCDQLLNSHRAKELCNTASFDKQLNDLERTVLSEAKAWLGFAHTHGVTRFLGKCGAIEERLITGIRALRRNEIQELSSLVDTSDKKAKIETAPPPFKQFDAETEQLMQQRWLIMHPGFEKQIRENQLYNAIRQNKFAEAELHAKAVQGLVFPTDPQKATKYTIIRVNLDKLEKSKLKNFDITKFKEEKSRELLLFLRLVLKYDHVLNDNLREESSKIINEFLNFINLSTKTHFVKPDNNESKIIENLEKDLPQELFEELKVKNYAYSQPTGITWSERRFVTGITGHLREKHNKLCEEANKRRQEILQLPIAPETKAKLEVCHMLYDQVEDIGYKARWEILHAQFPAQYPTYELDKRVDESLASLQLEEQWLATFRQILTDIAPPTSAINV